MTVLELKREASRLKPRELRELRAHLKGVSNGQSEDPVSRMKKLDEMKAQGLISDSEYVGKRAEIIRKL